MRLNLQLHIINLQLLLGKLLLIHPYFHFLHLAADIAEKLIGLCQLRNLCIIEVYLLAVLPDFHQVFTENFHGLYHPLLYTEQKNNGYCNSQQDKQNNEHLKDHNSHHAAVILHYDTDTKLCIFQRLMNHGIFHAEYILVQF